MTPTTNATNLNKTHPTLNHSKHTPSQDKTIWIYTIQRETCRAIMSWIWLPYFTASKQSVDPTEDTSCLHCHYHIKYKKHSILDCPTLTHQRQYFNSSSLQDVWDHPGDVADNLSAIVFPYRGPAATTTTVAQISMVAWIANCMMTW